MTARQKKALAALLKYPTMISAALAAGVNYSTLRRWIVEDADFRKAYNDELAALVEDAANQARHGIKKAVATLIEITEQGEAESNRLAAAKVLIDGGAKLIELQSYETRIAELERLMEEYKNEQRY